MNQQYDSSNNLGNNTSGTIDKKQYFNLKWFGKNEFSALRRLNFRQLVMWHLQSNNIRIKIYSEDGYKIVKYWFVEKNGKFIKGEREFRISDDDTIDIDGKRAISDPLIYAIAIKLKYLKFEKTWLPLPNSQWLKYDGRSAKLVTHKIHGGIAVKFMDVYLNTVTVPIELVNRVYYYNKDYNKEFTKK